MTVGRHLLAVLLALVLASALVACDTARGSNGVSGPSPTASEAAPAPSPDEKPPDEEPQEPSARRSAVTLAFAGDLHFELHLADLFDRPRGALGPITRTLREADISMVNLETSITRRGSPEPKDYHFRTSPAALDLLDQAGVDVVSLANNHAVDYGAVGLEDTLRAVRNSPVPVVGIGPDKRSAFAPHRVSIRGTEFAIFGANTKREHTSAAWAAGPGTAGVAAARAERPRALLEAVRRTSKRDVVVVYLHWGTEGQSCPGTKQRITARALSDAGADVVVGSHSHVLVGSGWLGDTYVNYGLGNFVWYHNHQEDTGVLLLRVRDGEVVDDSWVPARIEPLGRPLPLTGQARATAVEEWRRLRGCTGLAPRPASRPAS